MSKRWLGNENNKFLIILCLIIFISGHSTSVSAQYKTDNIKDLALIYQGGVNRLDWTQDQFIPYVTHQFADGHKDWLFDGFLFLDFSNGKGRNYAYGYNKDKARKGEWVWLLNRLFEKGKALSALDDCIQQEKKELGNPNFQHYVVIGLPIALPKQKDWGTLGGKKLDFNNQADQIKAMKWYVKQLLRKFNKANYKNIKLAGFYWLDEDIATCKDLSIYISKYIHDKNKKLYWIPYWKAKGFEQWKKLGFDIAYQQPNHFFSATIPDSRLDEACQSAFSNNMGLEFEFDNRAMFEHKNSFYNRMKAYIHAFEKHDVFKKSAIAYYSGSKAILEMYKSKNLKDIEIMDYLAKLIVKRHSQLK
ncbi:MAG: DUF4855 domain-containing protein [Prevotella sp.]|jgi:hypothetical protein|nr:DUF4855 domain-containing protein [Prevotella sp.]